MQMNKNDVHELVKRYFDGATSPEEEQELKRFLCSPEAGLPCFDEIKAVLGFIETARHEQRRTEWRHLPRSGGRFLKKGGSLVWRVAATVALLVLFGGGLSVFLVSRHGNECVAYINGRKCSDPEVVMGQFRQSLEKVLPGQKEERSEPEAQLKELFSTARAGDGVEVSISNE